MERLSTSMEYYLTRLEEIRERYVQLEKHEDELIEENAELRSEVKRLKSIYEPHYKPGDTILVERIVKFGQVGPTGFATTKADYKNSIKELLENDAFYVELYGTGEEPTELFDKSTKDFCSVDSNNVIGRVKERSLDCLKIKLYPEELMPEVGKRLLENLTKKEFDKRIRVAHRFVMGKRNLDTKIATIKKMISCYLIDTEMNDTLKKKECKNNESL